MGAEAVAHDGGPVARGDPVVEVELGVGGERGGPAEVDQGDIARGARCTRSAAMGLPGLSWSLDW